MPPKAPTAADAKPHENDLYETEIARDLFDGWTVIVRWACTRGQFREMRRVCRDEHEARSYVRELDRAAKRIATAFDELSRSLQLYGAIKLAEEQQPRSRRNAVAGPVMSEQAELLETVVQTLVGMLAGGETIRDRHARLILAQSVAMADARSRGGLAPPAKSNVIELATRTSHAYLNYSIGAFFAKADRGNEIVTALYGAGIMRVGDLVARSAEEIGIVLGDPELVARVEKELSAVCIGLGMRTSGWRARRRIA